MFVVAWAVGCGSERESNPGRSVLGQYEAAAAERRFQIPSSAGLHPGVLRVSAAGVWLADQWANRVALFGHDGRQTFVAGKLGTGPLEFKSIRDIRPLDGGRVAVLDPDGGRISILDSLGTLRATISLAEVGHAEQLLPLADTALIAVRLRSDTPLVRIDYDGRVTGHPPLGWPDYAQLHPLAAQLTAAGGTDERWAVGMITGPRFFRFQGGEPIEQPSEFVELVPPPEIVTQQTGSRTTARLKLVHRAAKRMVVSDGVVVVLFEGASEQAGRQLDFYEFDTGRYLGTRLLEEEPSDFDVMSGLLYVLYDDRDPVEVLVFKLDTP